MKLRIAIVGLVLLACGGHVAPSNDAGPDVANPNNQCNGYCPKPNGSACTSDCDCYQKCLYGTCAAPIAPSVACGDDAAVCPSGQSCSVTGDCQGAACSTSDDCPVEQQCQAGHCAFFACF